MERKQKKAVCSIMHGQAEVFQTDGCLVSFTFPQLSCSNLQQNQNVFFYTSVTAVLLVLSLQVTLLSLTHKQILKTKKTHHTDDV